MRKAAARSAESATIERQGRRLSFAADLAPNPVELHIMARLLDARAALAQRAAAVVQGIADGKLPTAAELASLAPAPPAIP